ncbi:molecular chaperone [Serratia sp. Lou2A]|jgi:P pilus assembly chaperone PapD|uniref:P pilus assembly chaperone PapD n=2 Tax=Serratia TaxID=613 RepID=A0AA46K5K4_SERMA|nr:MULTISPECIES: molecular chaperone [Serratia]MBH3197412.1 molecular chaperone [Serratia marcescens]MBI6125603.1 molecular chaperone [Serratia marcescens]MCC7583094.1 molecular chaperone [Serratia sp. Lou2A]MCC7659640.1 molecular chaperone [Serratia sp. Pon4B]TQI84993.1 P pilus assembly chaperone PapD [Serratia marcescens]
MKQCLIFVGLFFGSFFADANIVINGTRVIYPEKNKDVIVQLVNSGNDPALVQAWIDDGDINSTPETANVPFLLSPPVVKVAGNNGQQLRIQKMGAAFPGDRESVFYLNVLDIPPTPENLQGVNTLQLAIKSRIKLFYRPAGLSSNANAITDFIELQAAGTGFKIINKSPYFFTLANVDQKGKKNLLVDSVMVAPFSSLFAATKSGVSRNVAYTLLYIDDLGAYKSKAITAR